MAERVRDMDSISDVLSSAYTDPALKHVLSVLDGPAGLAGSTDSVSNVGHRTIRTKVERGILDHTAAVLDQLRPLSTAVDVMGGHISRAAAIHSEIRSFILPYNDQLSVYAREAEFACAESDRVEAREHTLEAYMKALYISDEERKILNGSLHDEGFFATFNRVREIHANGAVALLTEAPVAGELLMHESSKLLDAAFEKIKTNVEQELQSGGTNNLRRYMALLAERPLLFKSVLSSESSARKSRISREFSQYLSREQANAAVMPTNYLSSLLAWLHSAIVNEFEHISLLFDDKTENSQLEALLNAVDTRQIISELVNGVLSAIESQIRQRVTALVVAQTSLAIVDELQSVLVFYEKMLTNQFTSSLSFLNVLTQLNTSINRQFAHLLEIQRLNWEQRVDTARSVVITHDRGLGSGIAEERVALLLARDDITPKGESAHIDELNAIDYAITHLAGYTTAQNALDQLQERARVHESAQVALEVAYIRSQSSLNEFQAGALSAREFGIAFDKFLAAFDIQQRLDQLQSPTIARRIAARAVDQFVSEYEFASRDTQLRPAEEVRAILS